MRGRRRNCKKRQKARKDINEKNIKRIMYKQVYKHTNILYSYKCARQYTIATYTRTGASEERNTLIDSESTKEK